MIRHACLLDVENIIELCKEARDTSEALHSVEGCRQTLTVNLQAMIVSPHHLVLVVEKHECLAGVFIGGVANSWWHNGFDAVDLCFYIKPKQRGCGSEILDLFLEWAWSFPQTRQVFLSISYGGTEGLRTERFYDRKFKNTGSRIGATYSIQRGEL